VIRGGWLRLWVCVMLRVWFAENHQQQLGMPVPYDFAGGSLK
jgi:hypothetical protein